MSDYRLISPKMAAFLGALNGRSGSTSEARRRIQAEHRVFHFNERSKLGQVVQKAVTAGYVQGRTHYDEDGRCVLHEYVLTSRGQAKLDRYCLVSEATLRLAKWGLET